ncbi:hypothetical protein [Pseudonocardia sp. EV170527-09]|uniref:hypothetical protein n=1 Tax=Pseudonocardia sp. EV170527-09 TaxID=2603411 RepID=UPI001878D8FA|nr:hypothetical protein [Pseudonocardia sp. EV170527-09]
MNVLHRRICRSDSWSDRMHGTTLLPWATRDVDLTGGPGDPAETQPGARSFRFRAVRG